MTQEHKVQVTKYMSSDEFVVWHFRSRPHQHLPLWTCCVQRAHRDRLCCGLNRMNVSQSEPSTCMEIHLIFRSGTWLWQMHTMTDLGHLCQMHAVRPGCMVLCVCNATYCTWPNTTVKVLSKWMWVLLGLDCFVPIWTWTFFEKVTLITIKGSR